METTAKKIITVIVTYNRIDLLKQCIEGLINSTYKTDILIVNNNSNDGTKEYLDSVQNEYKNVKFYIYNLKENLNGAGGFNYGIRMAALLPYEYIWIMDDDCIVNPDSLYALISAGEKLNGDFGFLSSKVLWTDGSICKTNVQRRSVARKIKDFSSPIVQVDYASFVSLLVKREDVIKVGLPIKEFIIWTDDLEWTRRFTFKKINKDAKPGYLVNNSVVTHKCKNNFGVTIVKDTSDRIDRYKYIYRNDVYCFKKEGIRGYIYIIARNFYHILKILLESKNDKIEKIKTILLGFNEGIKFNPEIEYVEGA